MNPNARQGFHLPGRKIPPPSGPGDFFLKRGVTCRYCESPRIGSPTERFGSGNARKIRQWKRSLPHDMRLPPKALMDAIPIARARGIIH